MYRHVYRMFCGAAAGGAALGFSLVKFNDHPNPDDSQLISTPAKVLEKTTMSDASKRASESVQRFMAINGIPGVSVGVSVDGEVVWHDGFGYACVETGAPCTSDTVMCIASISKPITATIAARLVDSGVLDLDRSIYEYLEPDDFPRKTVNGKPVDITTRQLLAHTAGIRHYSRDDCLSEENNGNGTTNGNGKSESNHNNSANKSSEQDRDKNETENPKSSDSTSEKKPNPILEREKDARKILKYSTTDEVHLNAEFDSVFDALKLFASDGLVASPGERFYYTTHGYTLAAAVLERAYNKSKDLENNNKADNDEKTNGKKDKKKPDFQNLLEQMFSQLGMHHTYVDAHKRIVPHRSRYYYRNSKTHRLENTPQVNNSYKFAGGGLLSNVNDLLTFGNVMLYSYQNNEPCSPAPFLRRSTVEQLWGPVSKYSTKSNYGLGWVSTEESPKPIGGVPHEKNSGFRYHTGAAIGASSLLLVKPSSPAPANGKDDGRRPRGVCVAILANCYGVHGGIVSLAREIAEAFENEYNHSR